MVQVVSTPPAAPSRSDQPSDFISKADAFIAYFATLVAQLNQYALDIMAQATFQNYTATSTTSVAIGTGSKSLTISTGKLYSTGQFIIIANTAAPANYMLGQVTTYDATTGALVANITSVGGSGTLAAWTVSIATVAGSYLALTGGTLTGLLVTLASAAVAGPGFRLPHGVAPNSPTDGDMWTTSAGGLFARINGATLNFFAKTGGTLTGLLTTLASAIGGAGLNIPHGVAPTAPVDGDFWSTTVAFFGRVSGVTKQLATVAGTETLTNKTLTDIAAASSIKDSAGTGYAIGFAGLPVVSDTASHTFALSEKDKCVSNTTTGWVIPANASVAFPVGTLLAGYNDSSSGLTLSITTDTLRLAGSASTGPRTIAQRGYFVVWKKATTEWVLVGGSGVS